MAGQWPGAGARRGAASCTGSGESGPGLDWFRMRIRDAHEGRAPRVLDPFAGGGAIPLEAMRLGCEVTAADVNPVAWFVLKCTLDYPRRLAGQTRPLPAFALQDRDFMAAFLRAQGLAGRSLQRELDDLCLGADRETEPKLLDPGPVREADLAWQVRAWGRRVLAAARRRLAHRYPTYAEFRALKPGGRPFTPNDRGTAAGPGRRREHGCQVAERGVRRGLSEGPAATRAGWRRRPSRTSGRALSAARGAARRSRCSRPAGWPGKARSACG